MPVHRHLRRAAVSALALCFVTGAGAQSGSSFAPTVSVTKTTVVQQSSATEAKEVESMVRIAASFTENPPVEVGIQLKGPGGIAFDLYRESSGTFIYQQTFADVPAMDRAMPAGAYTLVTSKGSLAVNVVLNNALLTARITNWDELQRWNGRDIVSVNVAPTSRVTETARAYFSAYHIGTLVFNASELLGTPSTTLKSYYDIFFAARPHPGDAMQAAVVLQSSQEGGATAVTVSRDIKIQFTVARAHLPPTITADPLPQTVDAGRPVSMSVTATGSALTYLWMKDSLPIAGGTNATLTIPSAQVSHTGLYKVVVSNTGGSVMSGAARLTVVPVVARPAITTAPVGATVIAGGSHRFAVNVTGTGPLSYQWFRDGAPIEGAASSTFTLASARLADAGSYTVVVSNSAGSVTSAPAVLAVTPVGRISNLSIRTRVSGVAGALTMGITVGGGDGTGAKPLLMRAVGPTLGIFGVGDALADPLLTLLSSAGVVAENDNWSGTTEVGAAATALGAFALVSDASKDAAILARPTPGGYTVRVTAPGTAAGIALAEVYDATPASAFVIGTPRLTNVSALHTVGTGGDVLIAGFSIAGAAKTVLVRGIGPALTTFGVSGALSDPKLEVYASGAATARAMNDNWSDQANAADIARAADRVGAFSLATTARDAAVLLTLEPGSYTAQVSGVANATGTALIEVYEVPDERPSS